MLLMMEKLKVTEHLFSVSKLMLIKQNLKKITTSFWMTFQAAMIFIMYYLDLISFLNRFRLLMIQIQNCPDRICCSAYSAYLDPLLQPHLNLL